MGAAAPRAQVQDTVVGMEPDVRMVSKEEQDKSTSAQKEADLDRAFIDDESAESTDESTAAASELLQAPPREVSTDEERQFFSEANPSFASFIYGTVSGGPRPEPFLLHFFAHLEPAMKDMARAVGEKWLAAGGHTGTEVNPNNIEVEPILFDTSEDPLFQEVLTEGFTVECVKAMVGPPSPMMLFKFRHAGKFTGIYTDDDGRSWQGHGQMLDITGICHIMRNPATGEITKVDCYYNHLSLIKAITDSSFTSSDY